ncbi:MAG: NAD-binding protein [Myxococcales bacterium]|nr:NAD-binding protein [Myxococcales bacterium]
MSSDTADRARRLVARPLFEIAMAGLSLASIALGVVELASPTPPPVVRAAALAIRLVFVAELGLKAWAASRRGRWLARNAADVASLLVLLPWVYDVVPLRGVALLRAFFVTHVARKRLAMLPGVLWRGLRPAFFLVALVFVVVFVAGASVARLEAGRSDLGHFGDALWFGIYSVMGAEPVPHAPVSVGARVVSLAVILTGLVSFATIAGAVSAVVGVRLRDEGMIMDWEELSEHLIICGWNRKAEIIVREYTAQHPTVPVVVIAELEGPAPFLDPSLKPRVQFLNDDFTKVAALEKAGVRRASKCIILSDTARGRKDRDADARTILAALTIEKINPAIYTCAEINRREYATHLEMGNVNDYVVSGEHSAFLLAQAALTKGVMSVLSELLTYERGNRFTRASLPAAWKGRTFDDLLVLLKREHDALLVAVEKDGKVRLNPTEYVFEGGEELVLIAQKEPTF